MPFSSGPGSVAEGDLTSLVEVGWPLGISISIAELDTAWAAVPEGFLVELPFRSDPAAVFRLRFGAG